MKVFFITAFEIDDVELRSVLPYIKIDEFIQKPVSASNLTAAIKKQIKNESDKDIIDKLDIPAGLKELLVSHRFTIEQLLNMESSDIADTLGIGRHCPTDAHFVALNVHVFASVYT